jgi:spermidine synthase
MRRLQWAVFLAGGSLMGLEIVGSRILAPVFGTSIFVWGSLITTFLASLAIGYELGGRLADRRPDMATLGSLLALAGVLLWLLFLAPAPVLAFLSTIPVPERFRSLVGALVLFAPPSVLMGMVTPFAVRLAARDLSTIGSSAGRLSAISTAGSIVGTFVTAFLLIPSFASRPILFGLGASLLTAAMLVTPRAGTGMVRNALLLVAAAIAYLASPDSATQIPEGKILFEKETAYHHLRVVESRIRRSLFFNNLEQGYTNKPGAVESPNYIDGLQLAWAFRTAPPRSAVVIGLGAGMLPTLLSLRTPEIETTTIEIDPMVVTTARDYFDFRPDANDRVLVGDGRHELAHRVTTVDVIFEDAFFADSVPFHLMTKEFFELCRERLPPDGIFAANFVGYMTGPKNELFWAVHRTLSSVFPRVYIFNGSLAAGKKRFLSNGILIATRSPDRLDPATIRERAQVVADTYRRPEIIQWANFLYDGELYGRDVPTLTDAFSPTDALQHLGGAARR